MYVYTRTRMHGGEVDVRPFGGPLSGQHHLLPLVLRIGHCSLKVPEVFELEVMWIQLHQQHPSRRHCDLCHTMCAFFFFADIVT